MSDANRPLSEHELRLVRWMLEHGGEEAVPFLPQLEFVEVTPYRCPCGCATLNFQLRGRAEAPPGVHILADFVFGEEENLSGIFIFESRGILSGLEVYAITGKTPHTLPDPVELRPLDDSNQV